MKPEDIPQLVEDLAPYCSLVSEVMLIGADWSHNNGHTAKFMFNDSDMEHHPLAEHTVRRGKKAGTRFQMILIEIADDEQVVNQDKRDVVEEATNTAPSKRNRIRNAALLCKEPDFWDFLASMQLVRDTHSNQFKEDIASEWVRKQAKIESRAQLGTDNEAWERYQNLVQRPFNQYLRERYANS